MKGYYLFAPVEPSCSGPESGVERKVRAQHRALCSMVNCELVVMNPVQYKGGLKERILRRLPFTPAWRRWEYCGEFHDADFLYIRQVYHDASFVRYLKAIKQDNANVKIIYEVPTYPYDDEVKVSISNFPFIIKERLNRKKAAAFYDRIVTFYNQDAIWGVPCIKLYNGYDFSRVTLPTRKFDDIIHILTVSSTAYRHGYDRMIEGLYRYYQHGGEANVVFHMIGQPVSGHKELIERYNLADHVILHGCLHGQALKEMYTKCSIGIDSLGGHRFHFPMSSTLKSREYCAYGLPQITSSPIDFMEEGYPYQLLVPYDDSPVDIQALVDFYHRVYDGRNPDDVASEIREYARRKCDMDVAMKPVIEYVFTDK